jgi:hypothetical protein
MTSVRECVCVKILKCYIYLFILQPMDSIEPSAATAGHRGTNRKGKS